MATVPNHRLIVSALAVKYRELLTLNTYASCGRFIQHVLAALEEIEPGEWGHVGKTAGEGQYHPPGWSAVVDGYRLTGVSHDVIFHKPSHTQVDIIIAAAARSDPRPEIWQDAAPTWDVIDPRHYRPNNPWVAPIPVDGPEPEPNPKPEPEPNPVTDDQMLASLARLTREVAELREQVAEWQQWGVRYGSKIGLRTDNQHVVCAEGGGGHDVNATRTAILAWETFTVEKP